MTASARSVKQLVGTAAKIYEILSRTSCLEIMNQELVIKSPEQLGEYSAAVRIKRAIPLVPKLSFPFATIVSTRAYSMTNYSGLESAILNMKEGSEISLDRVPSDVESLLMRFEYRIEDNSYLNNLIKKEVQSEPSKGTEEGIAEYWMHAQLTDLTPLHQIKFGRLDLRDIDFDVDVAVHEDLKTAIPGDFIRNLRIIRDWIRTHDHTKKWSLGYAHLHLSKRPYTGREDEVLSDLQNLFFPHQFKRFVEVKDPFHYYQAIRGVNFYDLPFMYFPKTMRVISRTNLNLETPAAKGKLIYKRDDLRNEISTLLGILKKKRRRRTGKSVEARLPVGKIEEIEFSDISSEIRAKLRATIREKPQQEKEIQDALEDLFTALGYDFEREQVAFGYSNKIYRPDFTSDPLRAVIEVKLCKEPRDEKRIIDDINADIPAYKTRYDNLLFVVYDLGVIRKVDSFAADIEMAHERVSVLVIKH